MRVFTPLRFAAHTIENAHLLATVSTFWGLYPVPLPVEHVLYYSVAIPLFTLTVFTLVPLACRIGIVLAQMLAVTAAVIELAFRRLLGVPAWLSGVLVLIRKEAGRGIITIGKAMMQAESGQP